MPGKGDCGLEVETVGREEESPSLRMGWAEMERVRRGKVALNARAYFLGSAAFFAASTVHGGTTPFSRA